jgi:hypothetical protein
VTARPSEVYGCVVEGGVGVNGECAGGMHVEVGVYGVMFEGDEGVRPWCRIGDVGETKPVLKAVSAVGPEGSR